MKMFLVICLIFAGHFALAKDFGKMTCQAGLIYKDGTQIVKKQGKINYNDQTQAGGFDTFTAGQDGKLADDYRVKLMVGGTQANILLYDAVTGVEILTSTNLTEDSKILAYMENHKGLLGDKKIQRIYLIC